MDEIVREFLLETHENLAQLDLDLVTLEKDPGDQETLARVFRTLHTVKGTTGFLGLPKLQGVAHAGEHLLSRLRAGELEFDRGIASALLGVVDAIRKILAVLEASGAEGDGDYSALIRTLERLAAPAEPAGPAPFDPEATAVPAGQDPAAVDAGSTVVPAESAVDPGDTVVPPEPAAAPGPSPVPPSAPSDPGATVVPAGPAIDPGVTIAAGWDSPFPPSRGRRPAGQGRDRSRRHGRSGRVPVDPGATFVPAGPGPEPPSSIAPPTATAAPPSAAGPPPPAAVVTAPAAVARRRPARRRVPTGRRGRPPPSRRRNRRPRRPRPGRRRSRTAASGSTSACSTS